MTCSIFPICVAGSFIITWYRFISLKFAMISEPNRSVESDPNNLFKQLKYCNSSYWVDVIELASKLE